jgi:hypothetical protein
MKRLGAVAVSFMVASSVISPSSVAATKISNGVSCPTSKKDKTTSLTYKGIKDTYKCTYNPTATGSAKKKLVWVNQDCLDGEKLIADLNNVLASATASESEKSTTKTTLETYMNLRSIVCGKGW